VSEVLEILEKKEAELVEALNHYPPDYGTAGYGMDEIREQWLNWLKHVIFLLKR
jgi:hypothetical protein